MFRINWIPHYSRRGFIDPCLYCGRNRCQNSHSEYAKKFHHLAEMLLRYPQTKRILNYGGRGTTREGFERGRPRKDKKKFIPEPKVKRQPYITFTRQEMYNIKHYKPRYLPTHEEQMLRKYGY
jgi:hypothetical protein